MERRTWATLLPDFLLSAATAALVYYAVSAALSQFQSNDDKEQAEQQRAASAALEKIDRGQNDDGRTGSSGENTSNRQQRQRQRKENLKLNRYENLIATDVVAPEDIPVNFSDIGGLDEIIEELKESVIYPLTMPEIYTQWSSLLTAPSGVLLYGPPGCGKTMLAKALAHESGATFINLHIASVTEKWFGDSNKLVTAVFTLARKLAPSIVFIDEIDSLLSKRRNFEHEASGQVKAEFMTHWDGLTSADAEGRPQGIMVLGATNRMGEIDEAVLRRMPKKFPVSLPNASQRSRIFTLVLKDTKLEDSKFDLHYLVRVSDGMSGSDIKEACRDAAMIPMRELLRRKRNAVTSGDVTQQDEIRGLRTSDFFESAGGLQINNAGQGDGVHHQRRESDQQSIDDDEDLYA